MTKPDRHKSYGDWRDYVDIDSDFPMATIWFSCNDYYEGSGPGCKICHEKNTKRRGDGWTEYPPDGCTAEIGCRCNTGMELVDLDEFEAQANLETEVMMKKWEYAMLYQQKGNDTWICFSEGTRERLDGDMRESTLLAVLARLGNEGWEAVNYTPGWRVHEAKISSFGEDVDNWPQLGNREFLFKRPIEE